MIIISRYCPNSRDPLCLTVTSRSATLSYLPYPTTILHMHRLLDLNTLPLRGRSVSRGTLPRSFIIAFFNSMQNTILQVVASAVSPTLRGCI